MSQTPYAETEVLLAVMNGDSEGAQDLLRGFYTTELADFTASLRVCLALAQMQELTNAIEKEGI